MKTVINFSFVLVILLGSCATHLKCGEPVDSKKLSQKLQSKRYKSSIHERDSLCSVAHQLDDKSKLLEANLKSLGLQLDEKNEQYNTLLKASDAELAKLNEELNRKQNELLEKERSLADKEARLKNLEGLLKERDDLLNNITATLKKALTDFQNDEVKIEVKNGKIYISMMDKLLFKSGSSNVEPRGVEALSKLAPILKNNNDVDIVIEGHTDNIPIKTAVFKDNWDLSTYRATSVLRILLDNKVDVKKLTASGKGEFSPVATNETNDGRSLNRRTELILSPKLDVLFKLLDNSKEQ